MAVSQQNFPDPHPAEGQGGESAAFTEKDAAFMRLALAQAERAREAGEVPVGAVIVDVAGQVIGQGYNRTITDNDPTAHAEIVALRQAAAAAGNYRLPGARLYVTLEPCVMCLGAMMHARLEHVIFGAQDPKTGACGGVVSLHHEQRLNHHTQVAGGLLAQPCGDILRQFFRARRQQSQG
ncbi:tRNA adenosine(34) deaminase TadA [Allopusillimonas ginsengisoli]|uniref:tRNA adenosine(34) deaminase TadA n=1 Tax=Allopusillimonas ginsengisoli TaxID=453575 RepID=UPI0010226FF5|nr:tRNA adenosine(34) deaminase TadA [Allopusillimonas ginsengisoli]TEA77705.1 tRNA adenosine(34) deaminase TadA [Allopusillimonas ginsengisoli]